MTTSISSSHTDLFAEYNAVHAALIRTRLWKLLQQAELATRAAIEDPNAANCAMQHCAVLAFENERLHDREADRLEFRARELWSQIESHRETENQTQGA